MKISDLSIRRPVFASVMSLSIILFGVIAFLRLPVREYPDIDPPIVSVVTLYRGASASVVETEITDVLEEQFATISGVKTMTSSSREEGSVITLEFELNRDVEEAANDVRDRVSRTRGALPRGLRASALLSISAARGRRGTDPESPSAPRAPPPAPASREWQRRPCTLVEPRQGRQGRNTAASD